ncbi:holo-[acyl-carrier-protein] synthase [Desulfonatronovibrio hydrogenovorans]|uniref:holo-[acyl-carrier-protein] synthase n=1 Tax=Desulfonatronovibrio hydrogenovorans TaxID=53245 RepID=UPI0004911DAC|nr:holo-[acyl-carrier-protein] synthase [Desulfonatronovibrio hydrogenovorans]
MIVGLGLDVVEISRVDSVFKKFRGRFVSRILTPNESEKLPPVDPVFYLASRFAAKEAGVKALGTGFSRGITLQHLEISNNSLGAPELMFAGPALERARELGADRIHLSMSHGRNTAAAVVILERLT